MLRNARTLSYAANENTACEVYLKQDYPCRIKKYPESFITLYLISTFHFLYHTTLTHLTVSFKVKHVVLRSP